MSRTHGRTGTYGAGCRCDPCRAAITLYQRTLRERPVPAGAHGTQSSYINYRCRCDLCRTAHTAWQRGAIKRRKALVKVPDFVEHGKQHTYTNGWCSCDECRAAHATAVRTRKAKSAK